MATSPEPEKRQPAFAELHAVSNFTFLRGASHPEELVKRAHDLGYAAIAITDECSVAGAVRAHMAAKACAENGNGIDLIVGAEFHLAWNKGIRGAPATRSGCSMGGERGRAAGGAEGAGRGALTEDIHLVLLAPSRLAYGQLAALITKARRRSPKGEYALLLEDLGGAVDACFALWIPGLKPIGDLMDEGRLLSARLPQLWIALEVFLEPTDLDKTANALTLATRLDLPIVASNDAHMHASQRKPLQDLLTAIANRTTVAELGTAAQANGERYLRPIDRLLELYPEEMLDESVRIARRCRFSLDELRYEYPAELVPPGVEACEHLRRLVDEGAAERWPDGVPDDVTALLEKELKLVKSLGYEHFFLTVHDIVRYARSLGILCQGRGSAANSAICYCLHITEVDPSRMHMLFERFISKERNEPPDIDVDFEHERREEVIQYIYRALRPRPRGAGRHPHHLPAEKRDPRCRQGPGARSRPGRSAGEVHGLVGQGRSARRAPRRRRHRPQEQGRPSVRPPRQRDTRLPATPVAARRRLRHLARPLIGARADRERGHGGPHRHPVGQERSRSPGPA